MSVSFNIKNQVAVVTGGTGVLGSTICHGLVEAGAKVAIMGLNAEKAHALAHELGRAALAIPGDVCNPDQLNTAARKVVDTFGSPDLLINAAGGNQPEATTDSEQSFFDLPLDAMRWVIELNLMGTILACQVFGRHMAAQKSGVIINITSMSAEHPLTHIPAYSAAKAAVSNFTQWLAVHMAQEYSPKIRVNAIAPGFFITEQNRYLLTDPDTENPTPRGADILNHTPMGRFGVPQDLVGTVLWLASPASAFVTGVVVPVDGGFSSYSGV
jgi:NAD(P)-dependent dehydrogenase (short-subunit alcohol dehydrogenase family)